jgi:hypothetical protein
VIVLGSAGIAFRPGRLPDLGGVRNPFGLEGHPWVMDAMSTALLLFPLCLLASALSLVLRFLRSGGEERGQIKWIAFVASVVGVGFISAITGGLFIPSDAVGVARPLWQKLLEDAVTLSFAGVPVAVGIAVLKYRLYDIDILINRTLVYGSLTVMLALIYLGGVTTTQAVFRTLTGEEEQPQLAIVVSTLVIAALFNPLRWRSQSFIDRRFYRMKYDAAKTLAAFSTRLRDETDLVRLGEDLVDVVTETMQPEHVSLFLRPDPEPREKKRAAIRDSGHD